MTMTDILFIIGGIGALIGLFLFFEWVKMKAAEQAEKTKNQFR